MTDYREILRQKSLGLNHSKITEGTLTPRPTVIGVLRAAGIGLSWEAAKGMSDRELSQALFVPDAGKRSYKMPDYEWVHREMAKSGNRAVWESERACTLPELEV